MPTKHTQDYLSKPQVRSPRGKEGDTEVFSWKHISCHTDKNNDCQVQHLTIATTCGLGGPSARNHPHRLPAMVPPAWLAEARAHTRVRASAGATEAYHSASRSPVADSPPQLRQGSSAWPMCATLKHAPKAARSGIGTMGDRHKPWGRHCHGVGSAPAQAMPSAGPRGQRWKRDWRGLWQRRRP